MAKRDAKQDEPVSNFDPIPDDVQPAPIVVHDNPEGAMHDAAVGDLGVYVASDPPVQFSTEQLFRDRDVLIQALSRVARLHGQSFGEHTPDLDVAGLSLDLLPLVNWAKSAKMP